MRTPDEFIASLAKRLACTEAEAKMLFSQCMEEIKQTLMQGKELTISGFGKFLVKKTPARIGRHPQTGQPLPIKAKHVPAFKPGDALKLHVDSFLQVR